MSESEPSDPAPSAPVDLRRRKPEREPDGALGGVPVSSQDGRGRPAAGLVARAHFAGSRLVRASAVTLVFFALTAVFADLLAADLPLLCRVRGAVYVVPALVRPPALASATNASLANARGPGDFALHPLVHYGPKREGTDPDQVLASPSWAHPFGTDAHGRDVFARVVHGTRTTLVFGLVTALVFITAGAAIGALAGFFGGAFDAIVTRIVEVLAALPTLVLVVVVQALLAHPSALTMLLTIAATRWTEVTRIVRAEVVFASGQDYVLAARALGARPARVLWKHVLPNVVVPALAAAPFGVAAVLLIEAAMDFLSLGVGGNTASWGETLGEARFRPGAWWLLLFPGVTLFLTLVALNLVGEALRDALDPRLRDEERHLGRAVGG